MRALSINKKQIPAELHPQLDTLVARDRQQKPDERFIFSELALTHKNCFP